MKHNIFLGFLLIGFFFALESKAQNNLKIMKFDELQNIIKRPTDTLYVINFWATWCKPCIAELPEFEAAHKEYQNQKVKVLLVSLDFASDYNTKLSPFVKRKNINSQVVLLDEPDYNAWIDKIEPSWQGDIPATLLINNNKKFRKFIAKEFKPGELAEVINANL